MIAFQDGRTGRFLLVLQHLHQDEEASLMRRRMGWNLDAAQEYGALLDSGHTCELHLLPVLGMDSGAEEGNQVLTQAHHLERKQPLLMVPNVRLVKTFGEFLSLTVHIQQLQRGREDKN